METPQKKYLKDYMPPAYRIDKIDLTFDLTEKYATVTAVQQIRRNRTLRKKKRRLYWMGKRWNLFHSN